MKYLLFIVALLFGISKSTIGYSIHRIDGTKISSGNIDSKINFLMQKANVSGLGITIYNHNRAVYCKTFGLAQVKDNIPWKSTSIIYAASFAKMVFSYLVMQLVDENIIHLDTPLVNYLSKPLPDYQIEGSNRGYQDLKGDERYKEITARMCLTHTTGFPNWRWFEEDNKLKFRFNPGTRYSYSGEGMYLLQFVIEQLLGTDYETLSQERVFKPLAMHNSSQVWQPEYERNVCYGHNAKGEPYELVKWKLPSAGGSMSTTLEDMSKFYSALINRKGISEKSFQTMTNTQIRIKSRRQFGPLAFIDSTENDRIELGYGLGVGIFTTPFGRAFFKEGHDDGWGHYSVCFVDKKIAVLIMTNNDNGERIFKELLAYSIGDIYTPWQWENYIPYSEKKD